MIHMHANFITHISICQWVYMLLLKHFILNENTHTHVDKFTDSERTINLWRPKLIWTRKSIYIYIYIYHVVPLARISLTLSRHFSLLFNASGRCSGQHPVSSRSCCMYVRAGRPAFAQPYVGVHRSISLMSSSLLLQQCPTCLVRLTWIVFVMGTRWPYSCYLVGCCRQDLFNIALNILV